MTIQYQGTSYDLITNYAYKRLVQKCCQQLECKAVTGKTFISWLLKNKYIALKKNDTTT